MTSKVAGERGTSQYLLRSLGQADVLLNGQRVVWPARSAEELLWYLHTFPAGRHRHDILADLWDLEDTPSSANRFRVALHRLRSVLGRPDAVLEDHGRYILHSDLLTSSDTYALQQALAEARQPGNVREREDLLRQALAGVEGEYLPHLQGEWIEQARAQHRAVVVSAYLTLSAMHCEARECPLSAQALVYAAAHDPLIGEDHHQRLMTCLAVTRDRFAAIEHYRRYRYFLAHEVGDTPMRETEQLAAKIKGGELTCPHQQKMQP